MTMEATRFPPIMADLFKFSAGSTDRIFAVLHCVLTSDPYISSQ